MQRIKENIYWTGKVDWELKKFHGHEFTTNRGSTYNSYLLKGEKTILIDTVWQPFARDFVSSLKQQLDLKDIDAIVINHAEIDHSGALPVLMEEIPKTPIYCSKNAVKSIKGHYHQDWNFQVVGTGDRLSLGDRELLFVEAPMLHWPDSMMCYLTKDAVLFSSDAFGQHYAIQRLYNDGVDQDELFQEAIKYYANILTPFSRQVEKKIQEFIGLNLPLDMVCPSHGVIWRRNPLQIIERYREWAADYQEDRVLVFYDTMWNGTGRLAQAIVQGIAEEEDQLQIKVCHAAVTDHTDLVTEVFRSRAVVAGSPTVNRGILSSMAGLLDHLVGLGFKKKKAAAFGTYGWSGESVAILKERLQGAGFSVFDEDVKALWNPDDMTLAKAQDFGRRLARWL